MTKPSSKPVCVVAGVGPGNGAAFARRFASEGYRVALLARRTEFTTELAAKLDGARAYACDTTDAASVERTFGAIHTELGEVDVLVYNAGTGLWANVEDITAEDFEASWRNVLGALLTSKQVIPAMKQNQRGSIVFIGATASRRGGPRAAAFAPAKAAQKSLAESMARHLWPSGIHVALVILDGVVDAPAARKRLPDKPDSYFIKPDDVADNVVQLTRQEAVGLVVRDRGAPVRRGLVELVGRDVRKGQWTGEYGFFKDAHTPGHNSIVFAVKPSAPPYRASRRIPAAGVFQPRH